MTKAELIKALDGVPDDAVVYYLAFGGEYESLMIVRVEKNEEPIGVYLL